MIMRTMLATLGITFAVVLIAGATGAMRTEREDAGPPDSQFAVDSLLEGRRFERKPPASTAAGLDQAAAA